MDKYQGEPWGGTLSFTHQGPAGSVVAALGLNIEGIGVWALGEVALSQDVSPKLYNVSLSGVFDTLGKLSAGRTIDVLKALQWQGGSLNISGQGMILADWDRGVYTYRGTTEPINLILNYSNLIATATTWEQLGIIRYGGYVFGVNVDGFEPDYLAGRITYDQYISLFNAYVDRGYSGFAATTTTPTTTTPPTGTSYDGYLDLINRSNVVTQLEIIRFGGVFSDGSSVTGFEPDYVSGLLTYDRYMTLFNTYVAKWYSL